MFFVSFWPIVVLIVLNIVVSIVLDIYDSIFDDVEEFFKVTALTQELKEILKETDDHIIQSFVFKVIEEVKPDPERHSSIASETTNQDEED